MIPENLKPLYEEALTRLSLAVSHPAQKALESAYTHLYRKDPWFHKGVNRRGYDVYAHTEEYKKISKLLLRHLEKVVNEKKRNLPLEEAYAHLEGVLQQIGGDEDFWRDVGYLPA